MRSLQGKWYSGKSYAAAAGLAVLPHFSSPAMAQQPTALPAITVQGATLEIPPPQRASAPPATSAAANAAPAAADGTTTGGGGVPVEQVGSAVTVITGEELRQQQVRTVADALRGTPGVAVSRTGGYGSFTQVRIRGAEGNQTLVLIDGVQANNPVDGEFDFSNLAAEDIERIEVIRGPMSALYGSSAVGGVINIITRKGSGPLALTVRSEFGTSNAHDVAVGLSGGNKVAYFSASANWRETNGYNIAPVGSEADGLILKSYGFRGGVRLTPDLSVDVHARQTDKNADRDGFGGPAGTIATAIDDPSRLHDRVFVGGVRVQWDTLNKQLTQQVRADYNKTTTSDTDLSFPAFPFLTTNTGDRATYNYLATYRFDTPAIWAKHTVSGLVEREFETFLFEGTLGDNRLRARDRLSFAGEWRGAFADQVFLTAGVRRDNNSVFDDFTTWRLAAAWAIRPLGLRPHASIGTAVKFPALFEQFGKFPTFFNPNPNLQPETSTGWDAGVEFTLNRTTTFDVTYFHADLLNKISNSGLFVGPTLINLPGTSTRQGIEFALRSRLTPALTGSLAYTHLDAQDSTGFEEVRRPRHAGRADLAYTFAQGRGTANLGVLYNGQQRDIGFFNDPILGFPVPVTTGNPVVNAYWVVNAAASYKLQPGVELFGRVENLLDARYQEVLGYQAAPITAFAGVKLTFGGKEGIGGSWAKP
jgi:vitamin B12 transporter